MSSKQPVVHADFGGRNFRHPDLGVLRLRHCVGIGNLLCTWGEALLYARHEGLPMLWPTWAQMSRSSIQSGRTYFNLFQNDGSYIDGPKKLMALGGVYPGHQLVSIGPKIPYHPNWTYGTSTEENHSVVTSALRSMLRLEDAQRSDELAGDGEFVAVHVRRGDFNRATNHFDDDFGRNVNTPISIEWFAQMIDVARESTGCNRAIVISDGTDEELAELATKRGVSIQREEALIDMLVASRAKGFVASGSTFSMWISYIGQMDTWVHPDYTWFEGLHIDPSMRHVADDQNARLNLFPVGQKASTAGVRRSGI